MAKGRHGWRVRGRAADAVSDQAPREQSTGMQHTPLAAMQGPRPPGLSAVRGEAPGEQRQAIGVQSLAATQGGAGQRQPEIVPGSASGSTVGSAGVDDEATPNGRRARCGPRELKRSGWILANLFYGDKIAAAEYMKALDKAGYCFRHCPPHTEYMYDINGPVTVRPYSSASVAAGAVASPPATSVPRRSTMEAPSARPPSGKRRG